MEWILLLGIVVVAFGAARVFSITKKPVPVESRRKTRSGPKKTPEKAKLKCGTWKPTGGTRSHGRDWHVWPDAFGYNIVGVQDRKDAVGKFLKAARGNGTRAGSFSIKLQAEPDNPDHEYAIAVFGISGGDRTHLGYVPAELARRVASQLPRGTPLAGELVEVHVGRNGNIDLKINLLVPERCDPSWGNRAAAL